MTSPNVWFAQREHLNHSVLNNRLLVALQLGARASKDDLDGVVPFLELIITRAPEFHRLVADAAAALAPGSWLVRTFGSIGAHDGGSLLAKELDYSLAQSPRFRARCGKALLDLAALEAAAREFVEHPETRTMVAVRGIESRARALSRDLTALPASMDDVAELMS